MGERFTTCPLCEATCGLHLTTDGDTVVRVRGDRDDVFSAGYLCPKGATIKDLHADPDRVRAPQVRDGDQWREVSWDEAFAEVDRRLTPVLERHGRDAVAVYLGNPTVHCLAAMLYNPPLVKALGTHNQFSASTVDQMPKQVAAALMFGHGLTVPIPDVDRTDFLVMLGANPFDSNGSLFTAPDLPGRLRALRARGGRLVVVDPRRSRTAAEADLHLFVRPGTDALLLFALVHVLWDEGLVALGRLADHVDGVDETRRLAQPFSPEAVAPACGIDAAAIRTLARDLAAAPRAAVYGRMGTCTQEFGTLASWLVDVLNALTGNLDREGGAMFPKAAAGARNTAGTPGTGRATRFGRWTSRVRGLPEVLGELPVACLAEEIDTPGDGQVRALLTLAGNPVLSTPNSGRLASALAGLDCMVSVDVYRNETTRFAHVLLPAESPLQRPHYDLAFNQLAIRNVAHWSPPVLPPDPDRPRDWEVSLRLVGIALGQGPAADVAALDDLLAAELVRREVQTAESPLAGREVDDVLAALAPRRGPERLLDLMLRAGPYGDGFGARPDGISLATLEAHPHGLDLGPMSPRLPEVLRTPTGRVDLAPEPIVADVARLQAALGRRANGGLVLVGRRHLRSNNSWMHNVPLLVSGPARCTLQVHPDDAARLGLVDGGDAKVASRAGQVLAPVEVTDAVMPGVVSLPHGWGHDAPGAQLTVASAHAGVNSNVLTDEFEVDPLSGTAVLNGIPVAVGPA